MANLPEQNIWEAGIYQLEETDVVRGGPVEEGGISNLQAQQLASRTHYLYQRLGTSTEEVKIIKVTADLTITTDDVYRKLLLLEAGGKNKVVTLNPSDIPDNGLVQIQALASSPLVAQGNIRIAVSNYTVIGGPVGASDRLWLYPGESLTAMVSDTNFIVLNLNSGWRDVGQIGYGWGLIEGALALDGSTKNRDDYPRLWEYVNRTGDVVTDAQWLQNSAANKGKFSSGNGTTTFRLPDLRGLFIRSRDIGAGVDLDRSVSSQGSYQADQIKQHSHSFNMPKGDVSTGDKAVNISVNHPKTNGTYSYTTGTAGGVETRPKNVAYTAYIRY